MLFAVCAPVLVQPHCALVARVVACTRSNLKKMLEQWTMVAVAVIIGWLPTPSQAVSWISYPADVVAFEGQMVTLNCGINYPLTQYDNHHWVHLDSSRREQQAFLTEGKYISAALTADKRRRYSVTGQASFGGYTLQISQATQSDSGLYGCLVYSQNDVYKRTLSNFATVEVVPRALPTGTPMCLIEPHHPEPGTSVQFSCSSKVGASITTLSWSLDGEAIASNIVRSSDRTILTFRKTLGAMDNQAVYTCTEQYPAVGSKQASCSIVPFDMPVNISIVPMKEQVVSGESVSFYCHTESVPPATEYMWYYEGHPVVERPDLFLILDEGKRMTIRNVLGDDFSKYTVRCTVKNVLLMKRSATAFLDVIPLSQRDAMLEKTVRENRTLTLSQDATGSDNSHAEFLPGGMHDGTLLTVLIALTASIGTAILLVLAMILIACLRRPIKHRLGSSSGVDGDRQPLHEISIPLQEVKQVKSSPARRKSSTTSRRRPLSASSYQPLRRDTSLSTGAPKKPSPRRKVSSPAAPQAHIKSVSLYENAVPLRLSLTDGLNEEMATKTHRKGPFAPVSI